MDDPLYSKYDLSGLEPEKIAKFFRSEGAVDAYCVQCERQSVFQISGISYGFEDEAKKIPTFGAILTVTAKCSRRPENTYTTSCPGELVACFYRNGNEVTKIGQFPSKAELDFGALDQAFNKELDKDLRKELGTAIGLRAYGVGVGSFVYLRRIFERLIEEAHREGRENSGWDEPLFEKSRMAERIQLLHGHLPNRLVKTSHLYGILSKALHELSEEECKDNFDLILKAIQMILKERHEDREYGQLVKDIQRAGERMLAPNPKAS